MQNVWGEENVPENAPSRKLLDPSKRAFGLLCRGLLYRKKRALTPEGGGKRTVRGGVQNPFLGGVSFVRFSTPLFSFKNSGFEVSAVVFYYRRSEFTTDSKFTIRSVFSTGGSFGYDHQRTIAIRIAAITLTSHSAITIARFRPSKTATLRKVSEHPPNFGKTWALAEAILRLQQDANMNNIL